jgi:hypothetical protein
MSKYTKLLSLSLILLISITACAAGDEMPEILVQTEIVTLQTTPSLEPWLADVANCANSIPDFAVVTQILPWEDLDLNQADLTLRLGDRQESDPFVALMGTEQTIILAGPEVPVEALSLNSLQKIFSGEITNWNQVPELITAGVEINQFITTLSYPEGHELRRLFQQAYLGEQAIASEPLIFSTEAALESLLESYPYGLGYTLESLAPAGTQRLTIRAFNTAQAQHRVLALTPVEPVGKLRQLLLCLQN